jgi:glycogen debranching enzyme
MTDEIIRVNDSYYILATSTRVDDRRRVLKHGDTFAVFDRYGDIENVGPPEFGIYHHDTRFLSRLGLRLGSYRPLLLSSTVKEDNALLSVDLTNPDVAQPNNVIVPRGTLHVFRSKILWDGICYDHVRLHNYGRLPIQLSLVFELDADFADLFEVRGLDRKQRGMRHPPRIDGNVIEFSYEGLDGHLRRTVVSCQPDPAEIAKDHVRYDLHIEPSGAAECELMIRCDANGGDIAGLRYSEAATKIATEYESARARAPEIVTSNTQFNDWMQRSIADLHVLRTETPQGAYPYAGIPWFCTPFGRDGIITALQTLWYDPEIARGVLSFLSATQAERDDPEHDAQPGKILHEARAGEMAALSEVPFGRYYGSVDATPLFVLLAGAYQLRTGDTAFSKEIWPHVVRAVEWIDHYGDVDGDGFVEYARRNPQGLVQQGWKDSVDSVFHADGSLADAPIALCEVQGYVYAAKTAAAYLARTVAGKTELAEDLTRQAERLRQAFEERFWCEDLGTYALALDGQKRLCRVRTSNPGHCLYTGIANVERAHRVAATLLDEPTFSGWGIRTVAAVETRYNPMSYHNGSVWPHDNSLIAAGFARYGMRAETSRVLSAMLDASRWFDLHRLPELFCGFHRRTGESPTLYPVSCAPQAWAAGAALLLLQASLGLEIAAEPAESLVIDSYLPPFLREIQINGVQVGTTTVDLFLSRRHDAVQVSALRGDNVVRIRNGGRGVR